MPLPHRTVKLLMKTLSHPGQCNHKSLDKGNWTSWILKTFHLSSKRLLQFWWVDERWSVFKIQEEVQSPLFKLLRKLSNISVSRLVCENSSRETSFPDMLNVRLSAWCMKAPLLKDAKSKWSKWKTAIYELWRCVTWWRPINEEKNRLQWSCFRQFRSSVFCGRKTLFNLWYSLTVRSGCTLTLVLYFL